MVATGDAIYSLRSVPLLAPPASFGDSISTHPFRTSMDLGSVNLSGPADTVCLHNPLRQQASEMKHFSFTRFRLTSYWCQWAYPISCTGGFGAEVSQTTHPPGGCTIPNPGPPYPFISWGTETRTAPGTQDADVPRLSTKRQPCHVLVIPLADTQHPVATSPATAHGTDDPGELSVVTPRRLPQTATASFKQSIIRGWIHSSQDALPFVSLPCSSPFSPLSFVRSFWCSSPLAWYLTMNFRSLIKMLNEACNVTSAFHGYWHPPWTPTALSGKIHRSQTHCLSEKPHIYAPFQWFYSL